MNYIKYRLKTRSIEDYRPLIDMSEIKCPWWCSGEGEDYAVIVCYLPEGEDIRKYWDDAYDVEKETVDSITYTDRFPKPIWLENEAVEDGEEGEAVAENVISPQANKKCASDLVGTARPDYEREYYRLIKENGELRQENLELEETILGMCTKFFIKRGES